jgi:hypothetical protein
MNFNKRTKIPPPKALIGYVPRATIVEELKEYLVGQKILNAANKARTTISDFKKMVQINKLQGVIINSGVEGKEQYQTQALGNWLFKKRPPYRGFNSELCPFTLDEPVLVTNHNLTATTRVGQVLATGATTIEEYQKELWDVTTQLVKTNSELAHTLQLLNEYRKKEAILKNKRSLAGKQGGRGRVK